jgi:hypothetical protein
MTGLVADKNKIQKVVFFLEEVQFTQNTNIYIQIVIFWDEGCFH